MARINVETLKIILACGGSLVAMTAAAPVAAQAAPRSISIPAERLDRALRDLAKQSGVNILFRPELTRGLRSQPVRGTMTPEAAARALVAGARLEVVTDTTGAVIVRETSTLPQRDAVTAATDAPAVEEDVVVTATKRPEKLISVPSAVTAITGTDLRRSQSRRFEDYLAKVPGANFLSSGEGTTQIILRGVTSGSLQASSTVGMYVDEAPYGSSTAFAGGATGAPDLDTSDIARIEVLRGPQGTLYGANALGGVIKFVTVTPDTVNFSGHVDLGGSFVDGGGSGYNVSGAANVPIAEDAVGLRVSAYARRDPGYVSDPVRHRRNTNYADVAGGRVALLVRPAHNVTLNLSAIVQNLDLANLSAEDVTVPDLKPATGDLEQSRLIDSPRRYRYRVYNGTLDWDLGGASLVSSTSYATFRSQVTTDASQSYGVALGGPTVGAVVQQPVTQTKITQELRLQSSGKRALEWRGGFFFTHERSLQTQQINLFDAATLTPLPIGDVIKVSLPDHYTEFTGFADLTYHVTERFGVTVGARYSHNRQSFGETETGLLANPPIDIHRSTSDGSWTWLINPQFKLTPDVMFYGRIATGYRPGGPTLEVPGANLSPTFDPDTLTNYELGVKASLLDRRLTLEADVFYIDWHNIQLNETVGGFAYITNGSDARSKGVELSASFTPARGLRLSGNATYTDAKLVGDAPLAGGRDGDRLPFVPRVNLSAEASYDWKLGPSWGMFVGGSFRHIGNRRSDFALFGNGAAAPRFDLGSYSVGDLRFGVEHGGVTMTFYVKNVGDSRGIVALAPDTLAVGSSPYQAALIQPRTFGIDLSASF